MKPQPRITVSEYVARRLRLVYTPMRVYPDGRRVYLTEHGEVPAAKFEEENKLPFSLVTHQMPNSDPTKAWLRDT